MPAAPPEGVLPLFLRATTAEKYGFKTGENVMDLVDYLYIKRDELVEEIQKLGVMSDFEPAKKQIESFKGESLLFVIDKKQKFGEVFLMCYTEHSQEEFMKGVREAQEALEAQRREEAEAEAKKQAEELARKNIVFVDKPLTPRAWKPQTHGDTEQEVGALTHQPFREPIVLEITRLKKSTRQHYKFSDRASDFSGAGNIEFKGYKDPNFKKIREADLGIQVAPSCSEADAQTTWHRSVSKAIQYEAPVVAGEPTDGEGKDELLSFLERVTVRIESALQQNEAVDIFHETFRMVGDDEVADGAQGENELRELKNFADPTYSKSKILPAVDWMPKAQGMVAVSAVMKYSFDQRITVSGQTSTSYVLLWDFRQLVRPQVLMQCNHEVFTFRFNKTQPSFIAGGTITGQVVLWDIGDALAVAAKRSGRGSGHMGSFGGDDDDDVGTVIVSPKYVSNVDGSHKRCVADLVWLPPSTQINFRGQLVGPEHLDGHSHQFITVAGDGMVMVWDTRFEQIALGELKHIGRAKQAQQEKAAKEGGQVRPPWVPIYKAHLKRMDEVGELSLNRVSCSANLKPSVTQNSKLQGDSRSHLMITTEEGDIIWADIRKPEGTGHTKDKDKEKEKEDDDEDAEARDFVRWIAKDHPRPSVSMQQSPFFADIVLSIGDWNFHIWRVGDSKPLYTSPQSSSYLTGGAWSPTRPAVLIVATDSGHIEVWDFTDSSFRPSMKLKATHNRLTSMEFLTGSVLKQQLLAAGDETGTLHVFEMPRAVIRPVHKEEILMQAFLDREEERMDYVAQAAAEEAKLNQPDPNAMGADDPFSIPMAAVPMASSGGVPTDARAAAAANAAAAALAAEEAQRISKERVKKEDDDFSKLEATFLSELGLGPPVEPTTAKK